MCQLNVDLCFRALTLLSMMLLPFRYEVYEI
jgi:hypothetical protein